MSADLYLHVLTPEFTATHYAILETNTIGSPFFCVDAIENDDISDVATALARAMGYADLDDVYQLLENAPGIWIGGVSWLKAAIMEDEGKYVPSAVGAINDIVADHFPVIDDHLIVEISAALALPNITCYRLNDAAKIMQWLGDNRGKVVIAISK